MCGNFKKKYPNNHPKKGHWKFKRGENSQKSKLFMASMKMNWYFQRGKGRGGGFKLKNLPWGCRGT